LECWLRDGKTQKYKTLKFTFDLQRVVPPRTGGEVWIFGFKTQPTNKQTERKCCLLENQKEDQK